MKKWLITAAIVIIALAGFVGVKMVRGIQEVNAIDISDIDLSNVADGMYTGICDYGIISATVRVHVEGNHIDKIEIMKHDNGRGASAEKIVENVVQSQSVLVDTISGATASSKVILKAIENALSQQN